MAAVCVQRLPLLSREKTELELRVEAMKDTLRAEKSRLSDFELEESENQRLKRQREKRALEGDVGNIQVSFSFILEPSWPVYFVSLSCCCGLSIYL